MTIAAIIVGIICLIVGAWFFYLNNNSPVQTCVPAFAFPKGPSHGLE